MDLGKAAAGAVLADDVRAQASFADRPGPKEPVGIADERAERPTGWGFGLHGPGRDRVSVEDRFDFVSHV